MDRQVPPPDEDDGIGRSKVARRSGCETPRRVPPRPSCTMHPRGLSLSADMGPDRKALPRIARPQPGGEPGRNCVELRRTARARMPSAPSRGHHRRQHPAPGGTARDRAGRSRVTAAPMWAQAVSRPPSRRATPPSPRSSSGDSAGWRPSGSSDETRHSASLSSARPSWRSRWSSAASRSCRVFR